MDQDIKNAIQPQWVPTWEAPRPGPGANVCTCTSAGQALPLPPKPWWLWVLLANLQCSSNRSLPEKQGSWYQIQTCTKKGATPEKA